MYDARTRASALSRLADGCSLSLVSRETGIARASTPRLARRPHRPGECPRCEDATLPHVPYAALLGYYLGDGCLSLNARYVSLRMACDARLPGIVFDVSGVMQAVRPGGRVFHVRAPGTVVVQGNWKHWPCLFPQFGHGTKHERPIVLERWQQAVVEELPGASCGACSTPTVRGPTTGPPARSAGR